jgi:hypothetical protein
MGFSGLNRLMDDRAGAILVSVILGLGLAALFRRACRGDGCVVVRPPKGDDVNKFVYKVSGDCYKYTPYGVPCTGGVVGVGVGVGVGAAEEGGA